MTPSKSSTWHATANDWTSAAYGKDLFVVAAFTGVIIYSFYTSGQINSGNNFYATIDMSGNQWEQTISLQVGSTYTGQQRNVV
jgi:hypothetical protein